MMLQKSETSCPFLPTGENEDEKLNEVMQEAWKYNRDCKLLRDTLQSFSWNGETHPCPMLAQRPLRPELSEDGV